MYLACMNFQKDIIRHNLAKWGSKPNRENIKSGNADSTISNISRLIVKIIYS